MKILAKLATKITLFGVIPFFAFLIATNTVNAQEEIPDEASNNPILYVLDDCPHCNELLGILETNDIYSILDIDIKEVTEEDNKVDFQEKVAECGLSLAGVPTLYFEGNCYQGTYIAQDALFAMAGLSEDSTDKTLADTDTVTSIEELPDITLEEDTTDEGDGSSLADSLQNSEEPEPQLDITFTTVLIMLIAPAMFLGLSYMIIKKMEL